MGKGTLTQGVQPAFFNLREIIDGKWIEAHFQPIVSLKRRCVVGVEGLSRGIDPSSRGLISPKDLFHQAEVQGLEVELDRLCRQKALDDFRMVQSLTPDLVLSLNLNTAIFDQGVTGSGYLRTQVYQMGLKPQNIAIEIVESEVGDLKELQRFVKLYKNYGFLIALDDVGAGHSNLNRIPLIKPDILKIDRFLVEDIHKDFYKQEVLKSLVSMARHLGTLIIAEGVETEAEAVCLLDIDLDLVQGYYFSRPERHDRLEFESALAKIGGLGEAFKRRFLGRLGVRKLNMNRFHASLFEIQMELSQMHPIHFDLILRRMAAKLSHVESIYVLDEKGIQVTECVFHKGGRNHRNPVVFKPTPKGSDHTLKDYYYFLMESGMNKTSFLTEPYLSMASGNSCVTLSSIFKNVDGKKYILCLDINTDMLAEEPAE
jgi:EAL domain-containing protein (putative c-di-GMP-specific phosphodiesterase class I)